MSCIIRRILDVSDKSFFVSNSSVCLDVQYRTNAGRAKTKSGDYQMAQMGAGAHLSASDLSTEVSTKRLGHTKK